MKRAMILSGLGMFLILAATTFGAVPQLINFQGVLKDGSGNPVADASYSVTFTIYDAASGGNVKWQETQSVATLNGLFTVLLGSAAVGGLPDSVFYDSSRYLGIAVSPDPEMTPRQRLSSVGYSSVSSQWTSAGQNLFTLSEKVGIGIGGANPLTTLPLALPGILIGTRVNFPAGLTIGINDSHFVSLSYQHYELGASARLNVFGGHPLFLESGGDLVLQTRYNTTSIAFHTNSTVVNPPRMIITGDGNVGIGTESPVSRLDVAGGNLNLENSTASTGNILKAGVRFIHNFGTANTFIGANAGNLTMTGDSNTASGGNALLLNTSGYRNTASGFGALQSNTTGFYNTASGAQALQLNTTGARNTASGRFALLNNTTGGNNTAIGAFADVSTGNLTNATAIGYDATVNASNKIRLGNTFVTVIEGQVAYTFPSDKNQKENFRSVDGNEMLRKIRGFELSSWNYKGHDPREFRHYGPMAQDFFAAFGNDGVGKIGTETTLNSGDVAGILMIAVQALEKRTAEVAELKARIEALEKLQAVRR